MFQIPVENLDNIRKVRKKVKDILVDIGLDSCKELLKDLKGFDPGEKYFYNTSWGDIALWEPSGKKVSCPPCTHTPADRQKQSPCSPLDVVTVLRTAPGYAAGLVWRTLTS